MGEGGRGVLRVSWYGVLVQPRGVREKPAALTAAGDVTGDVRPTGVV